MRSLEYSRVAQTNLAEIALYIERESGSASVADDFLDRLDEQCRKLAAMPGTLGVARPDLGFDLRFAPFGNYLIFFRYSDDALEIVAIIESHRDVERYFTRP